MNTNLASFHQNVKCVHILALTYSSKNAMLEGRINSDSAVGWPWFSAKDPHSCSLTPQWDREKQQGG